MILVITGTHEQPFNRLVKAADDLVRTREEEVFIQYGYGSHPPELASGRAMLERNELEGLARRASMIITHGGPGSIWLAFQNGTVPIVVPRRRAYREHVDDHQVAFARHLEKHRRALVVFDTEELPLVVEEYARRTLQLRPPTSVASENRRKLAHMLDEWLVK